ncbi:MAG TPA: erythromycin esterase family protein [Thermomicrobiales bacterium]|jgi:erythromycin esterase-like protein|nr:erythromycin esterase family protein [Thermomicrobiales bacterium]
MSEAEIAAALDDWITGHAIRFDPDDDGSVRDAIGKWVKALDDAVGLLGFPEPLHGGDAFLSLRNRAICHLVTVHGFRSVAIESSFPRGWVTNRWVAGEGSDDASSIATTGFSHGAGHVTANVELVTWLRAHNAGRPEQDRVRFYGFDTPTENGPTDSPRGSLAPVLALLDDAEPAAAERWRTLLDRLIGDDARWEHPSTLVDPSRSPGRSPAADALRHAVQDLVTDLRIHAPCLVAATEPDRYDVALHAAEAARDLLTYHRELANGAGSDASRFERLQGIRDRAMADHLTWISDRERARGRTLVFSHQEHLRQGENLIAFGDGTCRWWRAGSHLRRTLGHRYVPVGGGLVQSDANGIGRAAPGTLEDQLAGDGHATLIPAAPIRWAVDAIAALVPVRSRSATNATYRPMTARDLVEFDWLLVLPDSDLTRSAPAAD